MADDFTDRSPHSIVVSTIGRMGVVGLLALVALVAAIAVRTWRAMRNPLTARTSLGLWAGVWTILVSACFGVVLEGPMGAVVFWSLLGILNASEPDDSSIAPEEAPLHRKIASPAAAPLPTVIPADEVIVSRPT